MSELTLADLSVEDRRNLGYDHPLLDAHAAEVEKRLGLPPNMLLALKNAGENHGVKAGSSRAFTTSPKGALGVMQFMPKTAARLNLEDPTDPYAAIEKAGEYIQKYIIPTIGSDNPALIAAAYNAGENRASLKAGKVPDIPETQKYAQRVEAFLQARAPKPAPITLADLDPEDAARLKLQVANPLDGMSRTDRVLAGVGKQFVDLGQGSMQLFADTVVNPASRALTGRNLMDDRRAEEAERRERDAPLMRDPYGVAGYVGGSALTTALPGAAVMRAGPVVGAANLAARTPGVLGAAGRAAVPLAASGAAFGALAPVASEGERGENAATGAILGPLAGLAGAGVGKAAGYLAKELEAPVGALRAAIPSSLYGKSWAASATPAESAAVNTAMREGVPVYGSQLRDPGKIIPRGRGAEQSAALDKAIARSFGQDTDDLVAAFQRAPERIGAKYEAVLGNKTIPLGKDHVDDLLAVSKFNAARAPRFAPDAELTDAVERAVAAVQTGAPLTGRDYQAALREYTAARNHAMKGTELKPSNPRLAEGYDKLIDALNKQANKVLAPPERALFREANKEWRNMSMLQTLAPKDASGNIDPSKLANLLSRKDKAAFVQGRGDQTLSDLARFGNTYMGLDKRAPRGLVQQAKETLKQGVPMAAMTAGQAALIGSQLDHGNVEEGLLAEALPYGVGLGAALLLNKGIRAGMDPRLKPSDLARARGALPLLSSQGAGLPGAAALTEAARPD